MTIGQLRAAGAGYRAPYIRQTAALVAQGFPLGSLYDIDYKDAKACLRTLPGVGAKVADCVLLYAFSKKNAFPVDRWIKKILREFYGFVPKSDAAAAAFAEEKFGAYAGIAQQYLFHYARMHMAE